MPGDAPRRNPISFIVETFPYKPNQMSTKKSLNPLHQDRFGTAPDRVMFDDGHDESMTMT